MSEPKLVSPDDPVCPKEVHNLPSGRTYSYVDQLGANGVIPTDELSNIYG